MPELMDMGYKYSDTEAPVEAGRDKKTHYPNVHISKKVPDELMGKEVGEMCRLEIVGKIVSKSIDEHEGADGKNRSMNIDIHKMGYIGKAGKKTKEEYLDSSEEEREEYDKEDLGVDKKEEKEEEEE